MNSQLSKKISAIEFGQHSLNGANRIVNWIDKDTKKSIARHTSVSFKTFGQTDKYFLLDEGACWFPVGQRGQKAPAYHDEENHKEHRDQVGDDHVKVG